MHEAFLEQGLESPFDQKWFDRPSHDHLITTQVDITGFYANRRAALVAHATQIDPDSPFWFGLPDDVLVGLYPWEDYQLAESTVPVELPETDLFAGLR